MAFVEDLTAFFDVAEFAVVALYNPGHPGQYVNGIFDAAYLEPLGDVAEGVGPVFQCAAADIAAAAQGDTLVVNAKTYLVRGVQPDGTGVVLLKLQEA